MSDLQRALRSHFGAARDVAREVRWDAPPRLIDLLDGGRRGGFFESPETLYSIGFLHLRRGWAHRVHLPPGPALHSIVSLHSGRRQTSCETAGSVVELADGASGDAAVDTARHHGLVQLMVRQFFGVEVAELPTRELATVERVEPAPGRAGREPLLAGPVLACGRFLRWRLSSLLAARLAQGFAPHQRFFDARDLPLVSRRRSRRTIERVALQSSRYALCRFRLAPGEALEVAYRPTGAHFTFTVNNGWFQGLRVDGRSVSVSSRALAAEGDGRVRFTVGPRPRSGAVHLCTGGRERGLLLFRELFPKPGAPAPTCRVLSAGS